MTNFKQYFWMNIGPTKAKAGSGSIFVYSTADQISNREALFYL